MMDCDMERGHLTTPTTERKQVESKSRQTNAKYEALSPGPPLPDWRPVPAPRDSELGKLQ